ncbi:MAG TPA: M20 family metallopeptidase [Thermomicrobiales bacterium]|nr:M20 family metallopeptidase [Thermomicrobiales bacterium]
MAARQTTQHLERNAIVDLASRLIAIPSPSGEELAIMDFVADWCAGHGIACERIANDPNRPNLVLTVGQPGSGPVVAMNGHLDTVPVSDRAAWRTGPFDPVVSDDGSRLYGRGASDMKSSVAVMLSLMAAFKDVPLRGQLQTHVVSDEETSGKYGTIFVLDEIAAGRLPRPDYVLIGEKSDLKVRNAERGLVGFEIACYGRAAHTAAARATGVNAIAKAAKAVLALEEDLDKFHPAVGKPVISINQIHAGVAHNVVPGECVFTIDRRLIPGETADSARAEIDARLRAIAADDPEFRYEIVMDPHGDAIPANLTPDDSPLVQALQASVREAAGQEPEYFVAWAGATDGRFYRLAGIDTAGYGPGGENAHGANEAVFIDDLVVQAQVWAATISRLLPAG